MWTAPEQTRVNRICLRPLAPRYLYYMSGRDLLLALKEFSLPAGPAATSRSTFSAAQIRVSSRLDGAKFPCLSWAGRKSMGASLHWLAAPHADPSGNFPRPEREFAIIFWRASPRDVRSTESTTPFLHKYLAQLAAIPGRNLHAWPAAARI